MNYCHFLSDILAPADQGAAEVERHLESQAATPNHCREPLRCWRSWKPTGRCTRDVERGMKSHKLRIAWPVVCGIACVLLVTFWSDALSTASVSLESGGK
jgi:hypothetical protein